MAKVSLEEGVHTIISYKKKIINIGILVDVLEVEANLMTMAVDVDVDNGLQISLKFSIILMINLIIIVTNVIKILPHKNRQIILTMRNMK